MKRPKKPKESPESILLRERQISDLAKLDEQENIKIKRMFNASRGSRMFRGSSRSRAAAGNFAGSPLFGGGGGGGGGGGLGVIFKDALRSTIGSVGGSLDVPAFRDLPNLFPSKIALGRAMGDVDTGTASPKSGGG